MTSYAVVTPPAALAVSLDDVKEHLRVDSTAEESLITDYIHEATAFCESYTHRAFLTQTWKGVLDGFPSEIRLARPPLQGVTSVVYTDTDGTQQTLSESAYGVDTESLIGTVRPAYNTSWPSTRSNTEVVTTYTCGYGDEAEDLPLSDFIADEESVSPNNAFFDERLKRDLMDVLATLTPKESDVLCQYFGLYDGGDGATLEEIGKSMGLTRERVRQIKGKAMRKLRHSSRSKVLQAYLT